MTSLRSSLLSHNKIIETEEVCACVLMFVLVEGAAEEEGEMSFIDVKRV